MITQEQIAQRAYEIWLAQGCQDGNDLSHWLQAEAELRKELQRTAPIPASKRKVASANTTKSIRGRAFGLKAS